jgi:hypothetical protein
MERGGTRATQRNALPSSVDIHQVMSRSRKRSPYLGICSNSSSAKPYKVMVNRSWRRKERTDIHAGREPERSLKSTNDPQLMAHDGKRYVNVPSSQSMRK